MSAVPRHLLRTDAILIASQMTDLQWGALPPRCPGSRKLTLRLAALVWSGEEREDDLTMTLLSFSPSIFLHWHWHGQPTASVGTTMGNSIGWSCIWSCFLLVAPTDGLAEDTHAAASRTIGHACHYPLIFQSRLNTRGQRRQQQGEEKRWS